MSWPLNTEYLALSDVGKITRLAAVAKLWGVLEGGKIKNPVLTRTGFLILRKVKMKKLFIYYSRKWLIVGAAVLSSPVPASILPVHLRVGDYFSHYLCEKKQLALFSGSQRPVLTPKYKRKTIFADADPCGVARDVQPAGVFGTAF